MNVNLFERIINSNQRVTRRVTYADFDVDQLEQIRELYLKKKYLNVAETAILFGVCSRTVYRLISKKKVVLKDNNIYKVPFLIDIEKTLENLEVPSGVHISS